MPFDMADRPYADIHYLSNTREPSEDDLKAVIHSFPIIDNHAHNLLREEEAQGSTDYPFESITSEAQGHALQEHVHSTLAHVRGIRQLAELFDCPPSLQDVKARRYEWASRDYDGFIRRCLSGTHALLLDDGLPQDSVYPVRRHDRFAPTVRRIARIEALAAELLEQLAHAAGFLAPGIDADWSVDRSEAFLLRFNTMFRNQIKTLAADPIVCGFKSVVCYRSGLDVSLSTRNSFRPHQSLSDSVLLTSFHDFLRKAVRSNNYRVEQKPINDFLVVAACDVLDKLVETEGETLPIQFHTGLGDADIDLIKANPAYMQPLIESFPNVDFVILHSSYPYTREAGYLAANFANAWLDIGEVFPMLARHGQQSVLRQALELTPTSKILWSTDGHFYPETFYLANRQFREALEAVLGEMVVSRDVTVTQAINMAVDVMFWNSNSLYKLDEERKYPQLLRACGKTDGASQRSTLVNRHSSLSLTSNISQVSGADGHAGLDSTATTAIHSPTSQRFRSRGTSNQSLPLRNASRPLIDFSTQDRSNATMSTARDTSHDQGGPRMSGQVKEDVVMFDAFVAQNPAIRYIWLQFLSNTGTVRHRMVPIKQFRKHLVDRHFLGITTALPRLLANEWPAAGAVPTGQFKIVPDVKTLSLNKGLESPSATVQTWWMIGEGDKLQHFDHCPRWLIQQYTDTLAKEYGLSMLMGFEIEIVFTRPVMNATKSDYEDFETVHEVHGWSNMTQMQLDMLPVVEEIVENLAEIGMELDQFHAEAAPTQWEFPLPPSNPLQAVDNFYKARDTIGNIARKHGLKATVYPRLSEGGPGSAAHMHFSINGEGDAVQRYEGSFLAGVLQHLPSIAAFSLSLEESYARVASGIWAGGEWVAWGTQNREAPIRKCGPGHWELKSSDGTGNAYLSAAAVIAAGLHGLREQLELKHKDLRVPANTLSDEERKDHGIVERLPNTLQKSVGCLRKNAVLNEMLGHDVVDAYVAVKEAEVEFLSSMEKQKRKVWLISRY